MEDEQFGLCIRSIKISKCIYPNGVRRVDGFDFAAALESVYPLLNIIFSYIDDDDLKQVASVKPSWKAIVEEELKIRSKPCWVTCYKGKQKDSVIKHSTNIHFSNSKHGIVLIDFRRLKLNKFLCLHAPQLTRMTFAEYIQKEIVSSCTNYCVLSCAKVVSYFDTEIINKNGSLFDGIFLPEIDNIRINMFHCNPRKGKPMQEFIESQMKADERTRCILLFSMANLHRYYDNLFKWLIPSGNYEEVAVCGGIVRGTKLFQNVTGPRLFKVDDTFCIVFLEKSNNNSIFNAVSHVIKGDDLSDEEFETELSKLKRRVIRRTSSVAFRICCAAKWANKESESALFNKFFPETPLLGLEADGELGWNSYNSLDERDMTEVVGAKKSKRNRPVVDHQWSTVLMVITWGELVPSKENSL